MDFIYSKESMKVFLSKNFDENTNQLVFRLTHLMPDIKVFWYIDPNFVHTSQTFHEMAILPKKGNYIITVLNELGNGLKRAVEITE